MQWHPARPKSLWGPGEFAKCDIAGSTGRTALEAYVTSTRRCYSSSLSLSCFPISLCLLLLVWIRQHMNIDCAGSEVVSQSVVLTPLPTQLVKCALAENFAQPSRLASLLPCFQNEPTLALLCLSSLQTCCPTATCFLQHQTSSHDAFCLVPHCRFGFSGGHVPL